ncbi:MAG: carbohydrate kinase family protein [Patescibacteria group bacterium]|nr:carbohydrate kinase family protein [Patescibacteria group bacterium]
MKNRKTVHSILVCGSIVYDRIMNFPGKFSDHILPDKVHILNVSFTLDKMHESFGGTGGNIAYNLALLGERPTLFGAAGSDFEKYADWLKRHRVDISNVKIINDAATASCYIMTDRADNQIAGFYPGSKGPLSQPFPRFLRRGRKERAISSPARNERGRDGEGAVLAIVSPDLIARMIEYVKMFKRLKVPYIFDPGQQITSFSAEQLVWASRGARVLIGNDYEIELILQKTHLKRAALEKMAAALIITKGEQGSEIYAAGEKIMIRPAKPKVVLDPTGVGDAYRAGLIKGLAEGWSWEKCGRLAAVTAVYTVEKYGTQTHSFTWQELEKRYEENYGEKL